MAHLSIHERGLAVGRLQAGQSVSQVRPIFELLFNIFIIFFFSKGIFFSNMITTFKKRWFQIVINLSATISSACVWLSQIYHFQAVAFIRNYVNSMRHRCEHVVRANGGHIRYYVVMTDVVFVVICQYLVLW